MPSQLIIKTHKPWKFWLKMSLLATAFILVGWGMFMYGVDRAGYNNRLLQKEQLDLQQQISELGQANSELREKNAVLERSKAIDRKAYDTVDTALRDLQDEILELKEQVAFYSGIVSPKETASGLQLTNLKFSALDNPNSYRFKLVLTQLKNNKRLIRGKASIYIDGIIGREQKQLSLSDVTNGKQKSLKLRFKYFQTLEGDVVLPEGFVPSSVLVDLQPVSKGTSRIKKNFDWAAISG